VKRSLGLALAFALSGAGEPMRAAEALPVLFQSAPGRFEVAALDPNAAQHVVAQADAAWFHLASPLGLPAAFSSPVFVFVKNKPPRCRSTHQGAANKK